jgi:hypothetical protein
MEGIMRGVHWMRSMSVNLMAIPNKCRFVLRSLLIPFAIAAGVAASYEPAAAQFAPQPQRDYFPFPFDGFMRPPPPVVDSTKAPSPRKLVAPPTSTVVVIGDSMADWLAYGLDETYADQPDIGVERKVRAYSGLIRYDSKNETLDWPQSIKDALAAEKPNAIVVMLGVNDRIAIRDRAPPRSGPQQKGEPPAAAAPAQQNPPQPPAAPPSDTEAATPDAIVTDAPQRLTPGGTYEFHTDPWAELYGKRIDDMIAALKTKGVPVLWVGLPAIRGPKSTGDMSYLDEIYRARAEKAGITYVDLWDGFVDEQGRFALQGPDFEGQIRKLRTPDGVHFTKAGAVKLASYVDHELRRVMLNRAVPMALPGPEESSPAKSGAVGLRPDVGPVVPLTGGVEAEGGDLLGASGHPSQATADPVATKVLSRGDAIAAPAGRADDFSWPHRGNNDANAAPDVLPPQPAALTPAAPAKKGAAAIDGKKPADAAKDAKTKPTASVGGGKADKPPAGGF